MPYGILAADQISTSVTGVSLGAGNATRFKNRIINGDMRIDQRNAGASVTPASGAYLVDRFQYYASQASKFTAQQNAGAVTPPTGFINYLGMTTAAAVTVGASDYFNVRQKIEGLNVADLSWGTVNAKTVTLSAWVYSSLTGTFGGALLNSAENRSYPFTYSISVANTWTQISVTIAGDTTGTWLTTNGVGIEVVFNLGAGSTYSGTAGSWSGNAYFSATGATSVVGTNGATWYVTGVQLEVGSSATGFDVRDYGTELMLCQRYYTACAGFVGQFNGSGYAYIVSHALPVAIRTTPAVALSGTGYAVYYGTATYTTTSQPSSISLQGLNTVAFITSGYGATYGSGPCGVTGAYTFSAEL